MIKSKNNKTLIKEKMKKQTIKTKMIESEK